MKWTGRDPEVSGFYWIDCPEWFEGKEVVLVIAAGGSVEAIRAGSEDGRYLSWLGVRGAKWAGPIPEPEEA